MAGGECAVSFSLKDGAVFNWRGGKTGHRVDLKEDMPKVQAEIGENSLMKQGTWAYLGSSTDAANRYLFWTSVNTDAVGAGQNIPVIIQTEDGRYYVSAAMTWRCRPGPAML